MIKLIVPDLPPWKVVPKTIVKVVDTVHTVKHITRSPDTLASAVKTITGVEQAYSYGVVVAHLCVKFNSNCEYPEAIISLGDDYDSVPWEW